MKFSVVIPLYNGADFIEATLNTVLAQTYTDYEIVMVNDGSPDNVAEVVKRYISDHDEIKFVYLEQENRGLGGARNTAMRHASGDVIAILDQDDIWYPNKLEKIVHLYKKRPEIDIICHSQNVRKNGEVIRVFRPGPNGEDVYRKLLFVENMLSTSAVTFRRKALDEIGYFSEDKENFHFVEDFDLWLRMAEGGYKFHFTDDILGEYTEHDNNYSKELETMLKSELNVLDKHYKSLKTNNLRDLYLMRRTVAVIYSRISRKHFKAGCFSGGLKYLTKACLKDPFFWTYAMNNFKKWKYNRK
jgi:glycosyltransferase involved in cell wall biosynthesis